MTSPDSEIANEPVPAAMAILARQRKLRLYTIFALGIIALAVLLTTTQTWWTLKLTGTSIVVPGSAAAAALSALALCGLALAAALAIAGPIIRLILGVLQLLIGFTIVLTSVMSLDNPEEQSASLVTTATGVSGDSSLHGLIHGVAFTPWGWIAVVFGVLAFLSGAWLLLSFRLWPPASRKYSAVRMVAADGPRDTVVDWDALSSGEDPTT
jgi:hypothetical protein